MNEQQLESLEKNFPSGCVVLFFRKDRKPSVVRIGAAETATTRVDGTLDEFYNMIQEKMPEIVEKHSKG